MELDIYKTMRFNKNDKNLKAKLSQEVKNCVTTITMASELLRRLHRKSRTKEEIELLEIIERNGKRFKKIIRTFDIFS
jgi:light-regulated signal transduction histidine kinase (bacteriophytochrome)